MILYIKNLYVCVNKRPILKGINLNINKGEIHIIMGPNGAGKSTLGHAIIGSPFLNIIKGKIFFNKEDITFKTAYERSLKGIFLSFQNPIEIKGVNNMHFLKTSINNIRKQNNKREIGFLKIMKNIKKVATDLNIKYDVIKRGLNEGLSGGEKKKSEMLQLILLDPKLCVIG